MLDFEELPHRFSIYVQRNLTLIKKSLISLKNLRCSFASQRGRAQNNYQTCFKEMCLFSLLTCIFFTAQHHMDGSFHGDRRG